MNSMLPRPMLLIPFAFLLGLPVFAVAERPRQINEDTTISDVYFRFGGRPSYRYWRGRGYYPMYYPYPTRYYYQYDPYDYYYYRYPYWKRGGRGGFYIQFR